MKLVIFNMDRTMAGAVDAGLYIIGVLRGFRDFDGLSGVGADTYRRNCKNGRKCIK